MPRYQYDYAQLRQSRLIEQSGHDGLKRRVLGNNFDAKGNRKVLGKYRAVFTEEQEAELVRHILDLEPRPNQDVREARQTEDPILEAAEEDVVEEGLRLEDPQDQTEAGQEYLQPGTSSRPQPDPPFSPQPGFSSFAVRPKDIIPLPKTKVVKKKTKRTKGTAAVLTSSPYKLELEQAKTEKENKENEKEMRRVARAQKMREKEEEGKTTTSKRKTTNTVSKAGKKYKIGKCGVKVRRQLQFDDQSDSDESDTDCLYCNELYSCSKYREGWIKCSGCSRWAHEACAGCENEDDRFVCEYCL
ncbi:hypothetical protein JTB14_001075 [Gonioctena quinquepunctata]|nr:hypothetical protein JTB14_001075 [Gonioctena quinquepunctata]